MVTAIKVPMSPASAKILQDENERLRAGMSASTQTAQKLFEALQNADAVAIKAINQLGASEAHVARLEARQLMLVGCVVVFGFLVVALAIGGV